MFSQFLHGARVVLIVGLVVPPCLALTMLVSSLYLVGHGYEEQTNPRLRRV